MKKANKGDLVYVPSGVTLYVNDEEGNTQKFTKLCKPINLLVTETKEKTYEIIYEGENWLVDKNKTYEVAK